MAFRKEVRKPVEIKPEQNKQPVLYVLVPREIRDRYVGEVTVFYDDRTGVLVVVPRPDASLDEVRALFT